MADMKNASTPDSENPLPTSVASPSSSFVVFVQVVLPEKTPVDPIDSPMVDRGGTSAA
jgi:hypothetical protein